MSHDILHRSYTGLDLSLRGGDGRTVYGLCCPFDQIETVADVTREGVVRYDEVFRFGAFAETIAERGERVKFLLMHDKSKLPLGRAVMLREDPAGLIGEFRVSDTTQGREALELIRDGALDGLSVGIKPQTHNGDRRTGGLVERTAVKLIEVSAVAFPAYEAALIGGVRQTAPDQGGTLIVPDQDEAPDQGTDDRPDQPSTPDPTIAVRRRLRLDLTRTNQ